MASNLPTYRRRLQSSKFIPTVIYGRFGFGRKQLQCERKERLQSPKSRIVVPPAEEKSVVQYYGHEGMCDLESRYSLVYYLHYKNTSVKSGVSYASLLKPPPQVDDYKEVIEHNNQYHQTTHDYYVNLFERQKKEKVRKEFLLNQRLARQDYTRAQKKFEDELKEARKLAEAIAKRHTVYRKPRSTNNRHRKMMRKEDKTIRPQKVTKLVLPTNFVVGVERNEPVRKVVRQPKGKMAKSKTSFYEKFSSQLLIGPRQERPLIGEIGKCRQRGWILLIRACSRTEEARHLALGLMMKRFHQDILGIAHEIDQWRVAPEMDTNPPSTSFQPTPGPSSDTIDIEKLRNHVSEVDLKRLLEQVDGAEARVQDKIDLTKLTSVGKSSFVKTLKDLVGISKVSKTVDNVNDTLTKVVENSNVVAQSTVSLASSAQQATENLEVTSGKLSELIDNCKKFFDENRYVQSAKTRVKESFIGRMIGDVSSKLFSLISNIVYCILSPCASVIAWAVVNILCLIFGSILKGIDKLIDIISSLWKKCTASFTKSGRARTPGTSPTEQNQGQEPEPQGPDDNNMVFELGSVLYTSIAALCSIKVDKSKPLMSNIGNGLFTFGNCARSATYVKIFMKDSIELLKRVYSHVVSLFSYNSPNSDLLSMVSDSRLKNWMVQSSLVLSPSYRAEVFSSPEWSSKVFELGIVGRCLMLCLTANKEVPVDPKINQFVIRQMGLITKLEQEMVNAKVFSGIRYEPYCLWISGKPGTGKSTYLDRFASLLAESQGYTAPHAYHTVTVGQKYFDSFVGQPTVFVDDFCSLSPSADPESYSLFLQMKSNALFNPAYAEADKKNTMVNFSNLFVSSNAEFIYSDEPGIANCEAYNRRRDTLVMFKLKDAEKSVKTVTEINGQKLETTSSRGAVNVTKLYSNKQLEDLEHVHVFIAENPRVIDTKWHQLKPNDGQSMKDALDTYLLTASKKYHDKQVLRYQERYIDFKRNAAKRADSTKSLEDYFDSIKTMLEGGKTPKSVVDALLEDIKKEWGKASESAAGFQIPTFEPATPEGPLADFLIYEDPESVPEDQLFEPIKRECFQAEDRISPLIPGETSECLHDVFRFKSIRFDLDKDVVFSEEFDPSDTFYACSVYMYGCKYFTTIEGKKTLVDHPHCSIRQASQRKKFQHALFARYMKENPTDLTLLAGATDPAVYQTIGVPYWMRSYIEKASILRNASTVGVDMALQKMGSSYVLERAVTAQQAMSDEIAGQAVPKKSPWYKAIPMKIWDMIKKVLKFLWKSIDYLAMLVIAAAAVFGLCQLFNKTGDADVEAQLHPSGDFKTIKASKNVRLKALSLVEGNAVGSEDAIIKLLGNDSSLSSFEGQKARIHKNVVFFVGKEIVGNQERVYSMRCLGLYNKKVLTLKHYIEFLKSKGITRISIVTYQGLLAMEYDISEIKFEWTNPGGYGVATLPESWPRMFKNIVKYMPSESFSGVYPYSCEIMEMSITSYSIVKVNAKPLSKSIVVPKCSDTEEWIIEQGFEYGWGGKGKCGSLVLAPGMQTPLIGIHTAGVRGVLGYGEVLLRETFLKDDEIVIEYVTPNMNVTDNAINLDGEYEIVGTLEDDLKVFSPKSTRIIPSVIHGVFDVETEPAPLHYSDPRLDEPLSPFKIGVSKRCNRLKEFDAGDLQSSYLHLGQKIERVVEPLRYPSVLSIQESIEGLELPGFESMEMKTSEGYPWVKLRPKHASDKSWMFNLSSYPSGRIKVEGVSQELLAMINLKQDMRERGLVPASYYTACLKDARILKEKVSTPGKTRIFEISPVDLTIAQRQYFLDFNAAYKKARFEAENTIGINPDGIEWSFLANTLKDFSPFILTADYSGYGPTMSTAILMKTFDISCLWYEKYESEDEAERNFIVRQVIKHEVSKGLHVAENLVFRPVAGMPSGNPDTVERNSLANSLYIRLAYLALSRENQKEYHDLYWFDKLVLLFHNGDDLIMSVKEQIISWFNNETLIEFFSRYGLKMTDAVKSGVVRPYCSIEEASYLKRGFRAHPWRNGHWLAPLDTRSVTDTANWIWKSSNDVEATLVNCEMSCRLAYSNGPQFYNSIAKKLSSRLRQDGYLLSMPSWESLDMHVWEGTEGPKFRLDCSELPIPNMDPEPVTSTPMVTDQKSNVVLESSGIEDIGVSHETTQGFMPQAIARESQVFSTMFDRWTFMQTVDWTVSHTVNTPVFEIDLPRAFIVANKQIQATQLFLVHRYWRPSMKVKIVLNSNQFQIGCLVVDWIYGNKEQVSKLTKFKNVYSAMQRNHVKINAGSNNDGIINIPYEHVNSVMSSSDNVLGTLTGRVLNKLSVVSGVSALCRISIFISFENTEYAGMISRNMGLKVDEIPEPEMDTIGALLDIGSNVLRSYNTPNRDNPPRPLQPVSLVPQAMPSFAYMDKVEEPINVLRADPRGQTPHPCKQDEMNPMDIVKGWGFLRTISLDTRTFANKPGAIIIDISSAPILDSKEYPAVGKGTVFTPLAFVSSMYGYYRGDIEYKFEIVCSRFHNMRFMFGVVAGQVTVTDIHDLKAVPHKIVDINDSTEIVIPAHWYNSNAWAKVRGYEDPGQSYAHLVCMVVNPVICIDRVTPLVYINVYTRAGSNFELAIPRLSYLAPSWDTPVVKPKGQYLIPYNLENAVYSTWERNLNFTNKDYGLTFYISGVTDGWVGFLNCQMGCYYELIGTKSGCKVNIPYYVYDTTLKKNITKSVQWLYYDPALATSNAKGLAICTSEENAKQIATLIAKGVEPNEARTTWAAKFVQEGEWSQIYKNGKWIPAPNDGDYLLVRKVDLKDISDGFVVVPQMDKEGIITSTMDSPAITTSLGLMTFGEETPHLKSLGRRWIHYVSIRGKTSDDVHPRDSVYLAKFGIHPVRKIAPTLSSEYDNRAREGIISTLAAPYLFYRGGLRFRFMVSVEDSMRGCTLYVQHRFDEAWNYEDDALVLGKKVYSIRDMLTTQYATFVQSLDVNTVSTVEVPFYQLRERMHLTPSTSSDAYSNGVLYVWVHSQKAVNVKIEVYYTLADDMMFSVFQGIPEMMTLDEVVREDP